MEAKDTSKHELQISEKEGDGKFFLKGLIQVE